MTEGEKQFDGTLHLPRGAASSEESILDIPVDITNRQVVISPGPGPNVAAAGTALAVPSKSGSPTDTSNPITSTPRLRLRDLVSPVGIDGSPDPFGQFLKAGASTIYREQGNRMIAVKFSVRGSDLAGAVSKAQDATRDLIPPGYRAEWSGEFQEMEEAEGRLMYIIPISLALIFVLLHLAFRSLTDAFCVLSNVVALSLGGVWALYLTGTNFSISAAVGFISIFGVAIMDGLLSISYFNALRAQGVAAERGDPARRRQARPAHDDDGPDSDLWTAARGPIDAHRRPDATAAGHRRGWRHDHDIALEPLPDAGALQLLRPSGGVG